MATQRPTSIVSLVDEADANSRVAHRTFERALILGPAVIALLRDVSLLNSSFVGNPEAMFIEVPERRWVQGVIGLEDVTFRDCRFENIAFIGPHAMLDAIRSQIAMEPPLTSPQGASEAQSESQPPSS